MLASMVCSLRGCGLCGLPGCGSHAWILWLLRESVGLTISLSWWPHAVCVRSSSPLGRGRGLLCGCQGAVWRTVLTSEPQCAGSWCPQRFLLPFFGRRVQRGGPGPGPRVQRPPPQCCPSARWGSPVWLPWVKNTIHFTLFFSWSNVDPLFSCLYTDHCKKYLLKNLPLNTVFSLKKTEHFVLLKKSCHFTLILDHSPAFYCSLLKHFCTLFLHLIFFMLLYWYYVIGRKYSVS